MDRDLERELVGHQSPEPKPRFAGPQEGVVRSVSGAGVYFTIPEYSTTRTFGPAKWHRALTLTLAGGAGLGAFDAHTHPVLPPVAGQICLVVFVGVDTKRPWIVAWW